MRYMRYLFFGVFLALGACQSLPHLRVLQGDALGTTYAISFFEHEIDRQDESVRQALDSLFEVMNGSMSTYRSESAISRLNAGDTTIRVDQHFEAVFQISKEVYKETDGYFDPTVGALVNAWGFGPQGPSAVQPKNLDSLLALVGFDKVRLNNQKISKSQAGIQFDFNAVAKGYTLDQISELLTQMGGQNFLIELGGEIVAKGKNLQKDSLWKIGIDDPQAPESASLIRVVSLTDQAMATSGNYRKFRFDSISQKKFVHTINPLNGMAEQSNVLSASVIASNCAEADAYATALMAMPLEKTIGFLKARPEFSAFVIYLDEAGQAQRLIQGVFDLTSNNR